MANSGDNSKTATIAALNRALADHFALYIKTKNFHWHVRGPRFRDLHLLFDEQAAAILGVTDAIAERVRKQGGETLTSIGAIGRTAQIADEDRADLDAEAMVAALRDDNARVVEQLKSLKDAAEQAGDNATSALVDEWQDAAEERVWFLSQTLR
jgi:starvation-inducible DNA-binding protein